ncbi:MAG TPA: Lrp/AsnC family transcriptional regulator [Candidatus Pacearchaeota archaeon]|jgi:Lrp/AsnC family transcriptional regulator|nr:Lrp/AsnC family transcriptional regulator [Candidatus Pacearchaeota archaeon]
MNLDIKDKRILTELDINARNTFQQIGKATQLSKETTINRIKNLEKRGIIQRYTTLVNFGKLGYTGFAIYSRFTNVNEKTKKEIIDYLSKIPEVYWIALIGGKYDIVFGIMAKSVFQFNKTYYKILTKYKKHLVDNAISIRTELRQHERKYLLDQKPKEFLPPYFGKEPEIEKLNELDQNILSILSNNARIPITNLSSILKNPPSTIALRIKNLEKREIIQGYTTYIKAQNYGMQSYRLLLSLTNMDEKTRKDLFEYTNQNPNMILAIETVGEWNFEITLELESPERLQEEIAKLRNHFANIIEKIEFLIMFEDDLVYDPYPLKKQSRPNNTQPSPF